MKTQVGHGTDASLIEKYGPREAVDYDVVIVGGGPAGLATAIRLKQLAAANCVEISVVVLEKGSEPGAHILSGAIMDPRAISELFPDWKERGAPLNQIVTSDRLLVLGPKAAFTAPLIPDCFHNAGNYVVSLGAVVRWLAEQAEALGVEIFSGFAANEILYDEQGRVKGIATRNVGLRRDGGVKANFQLGMALLGKYTIFAEGARGQLGKQVITQFQLDSGRDPQTYALGVKELWEVPPEKAKPGLVLHTAGWPMDAKTYGGGFLYHLGHHRVALGFVTGLDYSNPWLSPFEEMQRWKTHSAIRRHIEGGRRLGYGARAIAAGGLLSLPQLVFPGGALVGCDAGTLNAARIKGSHAAIKSGMLAAEAAFEAIQAGRARDSLDAYPKAFEASWLYAELLQSRNFKTWFKKGLYTGMFMTAVEHWLLPRLGVKTPPWTVHRTEADHLALKPSGYREKIDYPKPDGELTFDRPSSVFLSNTNHEEDQPVHLRLRDVSVPVHTNLRRFAGPEQRYCPAGVYEFVKGSDGGDRLQINAQNCVHCKTCDIKDPTQNIVWVAPEGGGPNYVGM